MLRFPLVILTTLFATLPLATRGEIDTTTAFAQGLSLYRQGKYLEAATFFEQAIAAAPKQPEQQLWLCRSYGHAAEQAGWVEAIKLARKTQKCLEQAVAMAPDNTEALSMLSDYYTQAPAFLGGSKEKATQLHDRLKQLEHSKLSTHP
jgi:tetratricopeptide (TPR) repeat protein